MSQASDFFEKTFLDFVMRGQTIPFNSTVGIGALTGLTGSGEGQPPGTEPSGGSYARKSITRDATNWTVPAKQVDNRWMTSNALDIVMPTATANWGTISHAAIYVGVTGDEHLFSGQLSSGLTINSGQTMKFPAGTLKVYSAGAMSDYLAQAMHNHVFRGSAAPTISNLYVGLFTTMPTNGLNNGVELTGNNYGRLVTPRTGTPFWQPSSSASDPSFTDSLNAITYPTATPGAWTNVLGAGIFDAAAGGNLLLSWPLDSPITTPSGSNFNFQAGSFDVTCA